MVYFRYDASSSVITSHADRQVLGCVLLNVVYKGGEKCGEGIYTNKHNTLLVSCEALKAADYHSLGDDIATLLSKICCWKF